MRDLASAAEPQRGLALPLLPEKRDLLESVLVEQGFLPLR